MWFAKPPTTTPSPDQETITLPLSKFTALQLQVCDQQNHINALEDQVAMQKAVIEEQAKTIEGQAKTIEAQKKAARSREASRDFVRQEEQEQRSKRKGSEEWKNEREAWYRASHREFEKAEAPSQFSFEGTEEVLSMRSEESRIPAGEEISSVDANLRDSGIDVGEVKVDKRVTAKAATFPRGEEPAPKATDQLNGDWDLAPDTLSNLWIGKKESQEKPTSASKKLKKKILKAATWK